MKKRHKRIKIYINIKKSRLLLTAGVAAGVFFLSFIFLAALFIFYAKDLPRPETFTERSLALPTQIFDREGKILLYQIYDEEKRIIIPLTQVPESLKYAILAAEDANFYKHFGLDIKGILRSVLNNLKIGKPIYGGSTISQQLIRSSFLTADKTAQRKIKEIILTLELERRYSKDQILEFYINQVPFGSNAYGVEAASQTFFEKTASQLTINEAALLASLIQAPSRLSPYGPNADDLIVRKNYILERMFKKNYISQEELDNTQKDVLKFAETRYSIKAPHFALYVKNYLEENYSDYFLKQRGLKVYTTLDWNLQAAAEEIVKNGVKANFGYNAHNASLVAINPQNGEILAMVGSADYFADLYPEKCSPGLDCSFEPKVNVAVYGKGRQPGSAFKPFAYAKAFQNGLTTENVVWDVKTEFNPDCDKAALEEKDKYNLDCYHPKNYDEKFRGPMTIREALAQSINVPAIKILYLAGIKETIDLAKSFGLTTLNEKPSFYGLSLVLGGGEVKLLDMVSSYGVFASGGLKTTPTGILKIEDARGNIIQENKKTQKRVLEIRVADMINSILSDNEARTPIFGNRSLLFIPGYQIAVKTGTTQEFKDGWAIGYNQSIVAGVWVGNNNGSLMNKEPGVVLAGPIWHNFMQKALSLYYNKPFNQIEIIKQDKLIEPHSILYYFKDKPELDPQYENWEWAIQNWLNPPVGGTQD